jgi:hypothetical protein
MKEDAENPEKSRHTFKLQVMTDFKKENLHAATVTQVHITVPAAVAFDIEKMEKASRIVLGKLGCAACHSGFDLRFIRELDFSFNERVELR